MNSVFSNHDEESDEERVVYLDIGGDGAMVAGVGGIVVQESNDRNNRNSIINSSIAATTTNGVKRKPLFQYRKYKGDLDTKHDKSSKVRYLAGFDGIHDILQAASAFQESNSKIHHHHPTDDDSIEGYQYEVKGEVTNENMPSNIHDIIINQDDTIHKHHLSKGQKTKNNITPDATTTTDHHHNFLDNSYNDDDGIVNPSPNGGSKNTHGIIQDLLEHSSIKRVGITTTSSCNVSSSSELHHYDSNNKNSIINHVKNSSSSKNNNSTFQKSKGSSSMPPISVSNCKNNNNKIPTGRMDVVTLDRPSHWMKSSLKPTATTALKMGSSSSSNRRGGGGHISPMRKKVSTGHPQSSWNRPKDNTTTPSTAAASAAAVAQPAVISLDNISTLCFRPSWMVSPPTTTSTSSSTKTRMIKNNNFASSSAGDGRCEAMRAVDAIQEDDFDDHTNHQQPNNHHHQQHRSSFNDTFSPDRTISSHHHHHQNSSSKKNDSFSLKFNSSSSSSSSSALSKAKPGSLKAKLLKIFREVDSIDTWMRNFSSLGHKPMERDSRNRGSSIDLQDPRNRAMHYIEFEVIQKLTDRYPFQVYLMRVLNSWHHHHHHHARDKSSTSRVLDEQLLAQESGMQDCLNASMFSKPTSSDELYKEGSDVVGYFTGPRDNGCGNNTVGSSKALAEGLRIRIYEPYVMPFVNRLKAMETIVMCTSFWEILVA